MGFVEGDRDKGVFSEKNDRAKDIHCANCQVSYFGNEANVYGEILL